MASRASLVPQSERNHLPSAGDTGLIPGGETPRGSEQPAPRAPQPLSLGSWGPGAAAAEAHAPWEPRSAIGEAALQ